MRQLWFSSVMVAAALACSSGVWAAALESSDIVVTAPRSIAPAGERSPYTGAPIINATVAIPVLYQDLDLAQPQDGERLMKRVERVAQDACKQLDRLFPFSPDPDCAVRAAGPGKEAARALIQAAQQKR